MLSNALAPRPLLLLGIDGADFSVINELISRGLLPNFARLISGGLRAELISTTPAATLPAWTSLFTGVSPSEHGVIDMFVRDRQDYQLHASGGRMRKIKTNIELLDENGAKVAFLGFPGSFPPLQLQNGFCLSGFDAPFATADAKACWPSQDFVPAMRQWSYGAINELAGAGSNWAQTAAALIADLNKKTSIAMKLQKHANWDLFAIHLQAADTASHHFWHGFDRQSPRKVTQNTDVVAKVYQGIDSAIAKLIQNAPADARVLIASDHGFCGASTTAIHINRLLCKMGLMKFSENAAARGFIARSLRNLAGTVASKGVEKGIGRLSSPNSLNRLRALVRGEAIDFSRSWAFSDELDYAPGIWLHRAKSFSRGFVAEAAVPELSEQIASALLALRDAKGNKLVKRVFRRNEIHRGPFAENAPDLTLDLACPDGFRPSILPSSVPGDVVTTLTPAEYSRGKGSGMPGVHRHQGVFIAHGEGITAKQMPALDISAAAGLILALCQENIPHYYQQPPAYWSDYLPFASQKGSGETGSAAAKNINDNAGHSQIINQRLQAMGYLS